MELPSSFLSRLKILAKLDIASAPFSDKIRMSCSWVKRATDLKRYAAVLLTGGLTTVEEVMSVVSIES